jgi:hypothetical protein
MAINGCGMLVNIDQSAAPQTLMPLDTSAELTASPSGTLWTASVVVIIIPSCGAAFLPKETPGGTQNEGIVGEGDTSVSVARSTLSVGERGGPPVSGGRRGGWQLRVRGPLRPCRGVGGKRRDGGDGSGGGLSSDGDDARKKAKSMTGFQGCASLRTDSNAF